MGLRTWIYKHTGIKLKKFGLDTFFSHNEGDIKTFFTAENYKNLVRGLDVDSINTVNLLLSRVRSALSGQTKIINTTKEELDLQTIYKDFRQSIVQVSDNCYAYKDFLLPTNCFGEQVYFDEYGAGIYFSPKATKDKNIIDAGGYIGDAALFLSRWTDKNVYVFEPSKINFPMIQKTIELNNSKNIIPIQKALSFKTEILYFTNDEAASHITTDSDAPGIEKVEAISLDEFTAENPMEIGLIKVDVEGAEPQFLAGARKTIESQRPIILLSIYHNFHDFFMLKPMIESWGLNYKFYIHKPTNPPFWWFETLLICVPK